MKSYTDLQQSKKLAEILPLESADMYYHYDNDFDELESIPTIKEEDDHFVLFPKDVRCWSLAALLDVLPNDWWGYNKHYFLEISKMGDMSAPYIVSYFRFREQYDGANFGRITHISCQSDNPVDACVDMITNLHEQKLL